MQNWNLEVLEGVNQNSEEKTFIGGKPNIPLEIDIPKCTLCNNELTFMFQIEFPLGHDWYGKTLAVFYCTAKFHNKYCIPEFPKVSNLSGANISSDFLQQYTRNFRIIVFDSDKGRLRDNYEEKVAYKKLRISSQNQIDAASKFVLGGDPIWIMGIDETPNSLDGKEMTLLLQIREDFLFKTIETAPAQATIMNKYRNDNNYQLFAADRIYFWGVKDKSLPLVYVSVQSP